MKHFKYFDVLAHDYIEALTVGDVEYARQLRVDESLGECAVWSIAWPTVANAVISAHRADEFLMVRQGLVAVLREHPDLRGRALDLAAEHGVTMRVADAMAEAEGEHP